MPISNYPKHLILFTIILATVFFTGAGAQPQGVLLPDMGDTSGSEVSPTQEHRTGQAVVHNIQRAGGIINDPMLNDYINNLGYQLISTSGAEQEFNFFIVNDKQINAFALPGGYIGVNYGLIMETTSENELAAVVAHEISHITQRHHARRYEMGDNQIPVVAALIAAMILGANNADLAQAAVASAAAGSVQQQINFTRSNEQEADRIGIGTLAKAGFDPQAMASFFERLDKESSLYGVSTPEFLRTHPVNTARIADARSRAAQLKPAPHKSDKNYFLMRARIRALTNEDKQAAVDEFEKRLKTGSYRDKDAEQYGYALTLINVGKYQQAKTIIDGLLKKDPNRIAYLVALAQIETASNKGYQANNAFEKALELYPDNEVLTYYYAQDLIKHKQFKKAHKLLDKYVQLPGKNPEFYRFLSRAEAGLGNTSGMHEALADYYLSSGQPHEAIRQIQLAMETKKENDFYRDSRMEAKLKSYQEEIIQTPPGMQ